MEDFSLQDVFLDMLKTFMDKIPGVITAIAVIIIGYIVSKLIAKIIKNVLEKIGIDRLGEKLNEIEIVSKASVEIKFSSMLAKIFYYIIFLFFLMVATSALNLDAVSELMKGLIEFIPKVLVAGIILVIGTIFADMLKNIVQTALTSLGIPSARLLASFLFYFLLINIVISALKQAQIDTDFLGQNISILIGGVVLAFSIGYGLASKTTMSNFMGSIYLKDKINIGDRVKVQGSEGKIIDVDKTALTLETDGGSKLYIPLSKLTSELIEIL